MKKVYIALCIAGTIIPYYFLVSYVSAYGVDISVMLDLLFANNICTFFVMDFLISCGVYVVFLSSESKRLGMGKEKWISLAALCTVGLSLSLPLFLFFRHDKVYSRL